MTGGAQPKTFGERVKTLLAHPEFMLFLVILLLLALGGFVNPRRSASKTSRS